MDEFVVLSKSIADMRQEVRDMRSDVNKLVAVEERVAALLRQSEANSSQIVKMWEHMDAQNLRLSHIDTDIAVNGALDDYNKKLVWSIVAGVIAIVSSIIGSNFI